jgi:hypothetical protein
MGKYWIQKAIGRKGVLRQQLEIPSNRNIPIELYRIKKKLIIPSPRGYKLFVRYK